MSGICTVDIIAESHSIILPLSMFDVGGNGNGQIVKLWTSAQ